MKAPAILFAADPVLARLLSETVLPLAGFTVAPDIAPGVSSDAGDPAQTSAALAIGGGDARALSDLLRRLNASSVVPVIWIGHESAEADKARVQFFQRPARLADLVAALCQYHPAASRGEVYKIGDCHFAPRQRLLWRGEDSVATALTEKESMILDYLREASGRVIDRAELLENVWRYSEGIETHTIETHIYRLRQKLEPNPAAPSMLLTESGGYRLVVPAKAQDVAQTPSSGET